MPFSAIPLLWQALGPDWRIVGPLIIVLVVLGGAYLRGRSDMNAKWEARWAAEQARILEAKRVEDQRQAAATEKLNNDYNEQATQHRNEMQGLGDQLQDYATRNAQLEDKFRSCRAATRDDVERLRKLAAPGSGTRTPEPPKRPFWLR